MTTLRPSLRTQSSQTPAKSRIVIKSHNVMESLVIEEVNKQIQALHPKTSRLIKAEDVLAYALNRLPCLCATSKLGWQRQLSRARSEFKEQINQAVHQGIIAVQRDPLHISDLVNNSSDNEEMNQAANAALERLKVVLQREDLSWENLAHEVEKSLASSRSSAGEVTKNNYGRPRHSTDYWETYRY
jgi:hypothetical protein